MREILKTLCLICMLGALDCTANVELPLTSVKSSDLQKAFLFSDGNSSMSDNEAEETAKRIAGERGLDLLKSHPAHLARLISMISPNTKKIDFGIKAAENGKKKIDTGKGKYDTALSIATSSAISLLGKEPLDTAEVLKYGLKIGSLTTLARSQNNVSEFAQMESIKVSRSSFPEKMCKEWQKTGFLEVLFGKKCEDYKAVIELLKNNLSPISGIALNIAISSGALKPIAYKQDGRDSELDKSELNYINDHNKSWEYSNELVNHCLKSFEMLKILLENPNEREKLSKLVLFILKDPKNREVFQKEFNKYADDSEYMPKFESKKGLDSLFHFKDSNKKEHLLSWKKFVEKVTGTKENGTEDPSKDEDSNTNIGSDTSTTDNISESGSDSEDFYSKSAVDKLKTSINNSLEKLKSFLPAEKAEGGTSENTNTIKDELVKVAGQLKIFLPVIRDSITKFREERDKMNHLTRLIEAFKLFNTEGLESVISVTLKELSKTAAHNDVFALLKRLSEHKLSRISLMSLLFSEKPLNEGQKLELSKFLKDKDSVNSLINNSRNRDKTLTDALLSIIFYRGNTALGYNVSKEEHLLAGIDDGAYSISMERTLGLGPRNLSFEKLKNLASEHLLPSFNLAIEVLSGKLLSLNRDVSDSDSQASYSGSKVSTVVSKSDTILSSGGILDQLSEKLDQLLKVDSAKTSDNDHSAIREAIKLLEDALAELEGPTTLKTNSVDASDASEVQSNASQDLAGTLNEADGLMERITKVAYAYKEALLKTISLINFKPSELIGETFGVIQTFVLFTTERVITPAGSILFFPVKRTIWKVFDLIS